MKTLYQSLLLSIGALALAGTAFAQVPSTNDTSDGSGNTGMGLGALGSNTTGGDNTASGTDALNANTTGSLNTASGVGALEFNTTGSGDTATGYNALAANTTGGDNTASGLFALQNNTTGTNNTASGANALDKNTTGSNNIAVGSQAGFNLTTGNNNIDIGNVGVAGESNTIRIGIHGTQRATFIAGIFNTSVSGSTVMVTPAGKLGITVSSERFKTAIAPMGSNSARLGQLRPVTFHLKTDPHGALQYGLIAEEVAKVYPELVIRGEKGRIDGVRYDELAPMLLNEVQQQQHKIDAQTAEIRDLKKLVVETQAGLLKLQSKDELVAHTWTPLDAKRFAVLDHR